MRSRAERADRQVTGLGGLGSVSLLVRFANIDVAAHRTGYRALGSAISIDLVSRATARSLLVTSSAATL